MSKKKKSPAAKAKRSHPGRCGSDEQFEDVQAELLEDLGEGIESGQVAEAFATFERAELDEGLLTELAVDPMVTEGMFERDTHLKVPAALKKLLAFAVAEPAALEVNYSDPDDEELAYLGADD